MSRTDTAGTATWFPGIEALRGIAAMAVVVHHSWSLSNQPRFRGYWIVEGFGTFGVDLFFLLSGFLLSETFWKPQRASLRVYAIRRFFRIAPAYYVNVVILFLFFANTSILLSKQGLRQTVMSGTFMQYLFPDTSSSLNVNGALWTLTIEVMLYAFLPFMALSFRASPRLAFLVFVGVGVGWRLFIAMNGDWIRALYFGSEPGLPEGIKSLFLARQFIGALPVFAVGIGARWALQNARLPVKDWLAKRRLGVMRFVLLLVPGVMFLRFIEEASDYRNAMLFAVYDFVLVVLLVPALVVAAQSEALVPSALRRLATWLGERSYSIYLWHFPLILVLYGRGPLEGPAPEDRYVPRLIMIFALTLVFAAVSYRAVEAPGQAWGRRVARLIRPRPASTRGDQL
ncbi:MAG: acyltransferase [Dermatophilaceae bacterium]